MATMGDWGAAARERKKENLVKKLKDKFERSSNLSSFSQIEIVSHDDRSTQVKIDYSQAVTDADFGQINAQLSAMIASGDLPAASISRPPAAPHAVNLTFNLSLEDLNQALGATIGTATAAAMRRG